VISRSSSLPPDAGKVGQFSILADSWSSSGKDHMLTLSYSSFSAWRKLLGAAKMLILCRWYVV
jgi:hypothetical protein